MHEIFRIFPHARKNKNTFVKKNKLQAKQGLNPLTPRGWPGIFYSTINRTKHSDMTWKQP